MNNTPNSSKNVLSSDVEIKGNLKFSGELTMEGKLEGEVNTDGVLHLGETGTVNGNVNANSVIVRGKINGNLIAKDKIEIKSKAEVDIEEFRADETQNLKLYLKHITDIAYGMIEVKYIEISFEKEMKYQFVHYFFF